jgi:ubiquitin carboxyl-terminal hydrolase 7
LLTTVKPSFSFARRQMSARVAEFLGGLDPLKLRFTSANGTNGSAKGIIKRSLNQSVQEILHTTYGSPLAVLFYEKLDISIIELETKKSLKVIWTGALNKEEVRLSLDLARSPFAPDLPSVGASCRARSRSSCPRPTRSTSSANSS